MRPQIEFKHVLGELSVNRNDPCEVLRELISNSYDAGAKNIIYSPIKDRSGFIFFDDGSGLSHVTPVNGITPWEAFFSIGRSTKQQGESIGYKCQGSKLCFASARILVATTIDKKSNIWFYKVIDNPRINLDTSFDIKPTEINNINLIIDEFLPISTNTADTIAAVENLKEKFRSADLSNSGTLVIIDSLDTENYTRHFALTNPPEESYAYNYISFYTRHGDVRNITSEQGFSPNHRTQVSTKTSGIKFTAFANGLESQLPFGYPYLEYKTIDQNIKSPASVARLRDGRFVSRGARRFNVGPAEFFVILAIDGNRRAHDEYRNLARKGQAKSGIRLSDQRGVFISVKGIKVCKYYDLLANIAEYNVLVEGDAPSHYALIIDGQFDLVTNRNMLSKGAFDMLNDPAFVYQIKKFLDDQKRSDRTFSELLSRLRRESSENLLNEQIELLDLSKNNVRQRERIRINGEIFLSPQSGEEYLVGVLYSQLGATTGKNPGFENFWKRILTFSTQGIDSLAFKDSAIKNPLAAANICSVEYKYEFNNSGPFNHALAIVNFIVAWKVDFDQTKLIRDTYTCFGKVRKVDGNDFEWEIYDIENSEGGTYDHIITVLDLRSLIIHTFSPEISTPISL